MVSISPFIYLTVGTQTQHQNANEKCWIPAVQKENGGRLRATATEVAKRGKYYILLKSPGFDNLAMEIHLTDNMDLGTLTLKVKGEGKGGKRSDFV